MTKKIQKNNRLRIAGTGSAQGPPKSLKKNYKHKPIHQLLGLIQWLQRKKNFENWSTQALPAPAVPWGRHVIGKELQAQVHPSVAGPNPMAWERKKVLKKNPTQTLPVPAVPRGLQVIKKCCKHEPINQLLGLIQWLQSEKKLSKSFTNSCKYKSIKHLLGLVQWLEINMRYYISN
jgi:hypothetical protein